MTEELKKKLQELAAKYHTTDFIHSDPVQFPHRFERKQDIEISGLLTAIMSFGNRKQIVSKANLLHSIMGKPLEYVESGKWETDFPADDKSSFYRMLSYSDFNSYFSRLHKAYSSFESLEDALNQYEGLPMERLCSFLEVSPKGAQKKLNMFLRWMVRRNSPVDFGIWESFSPADLIIPMDTHVCHVAARLGLVASSSPTLRNARLITAVLSEAFPNDPCLGDFALFGSGVNGGE